MPSSTTDLARGFDPEIQTRSNPSTEWLLQARADLNSDHKLQVALQDNTEGAVSRMASILVGRWNNGYWFEAFEASQYLYDEYRQLGEGIHLVSQDTGRVVVTIDETDLYQPAPVPREFSPVLATPLRQIRPDLAAFITTYSFDRAREQQIVETLRDRGHTTDLLNDEGDPRLLVASRRGRQQLVTELADRPLDRLFIRTARLFSHLTMSEDEPEDTSLDPLEAVLSGHTTRPIQDVTATNTRFDSTAIIRSGLTSGWTEGIVSTLAGNLPPDRLFDPEQLTFDEVGIQRPYSWIVPSGTSSVPKFINTSPVPIWVPQNIPLFLELQGHVAHVEIQGKIAMTSREVFDRWEVHWQSYVRLWIRWSSVRGVEPPEDVAYEGEVER